MLRWRYRLHELTRGRPERAKLEFVHCRDIKSALSMKPRANSRPAMGVHLQERTPEGAKSALSTNTNVHPQERTPEGAKSELSTKHCERQEVP